MIDESAKVEMTSEQLAQRLAETRRSAKAELLKELGFDSKDAAVRAYAEIAPMQERIRALEGFEATATRHGATVKRMADEALSQLPEKVQAAIKKRAKDDPDAILDHIAFHRETATEDKPPPKTEEKAPEVKVDVPNPLATTAAPATPPAPAGAEPTPYQRWKDVETRNGPMAGQIFYQGNSKAIEASRPVDSE